MPEVQFNAVYKTQSKTTYSSFFILDKHYLNSETITVHNHTERTPNLDICMNLDSRGESVLCQTG